MGGFTLKWNSNKSVDRGVVWTDLAQDMIRWRDVVTAVINLAGFVKCRGFLD
jgi:hypothetical protein